MSMILDFDAYDENDLKDVDLGKQVIEVLAKYYPNHPWCVEANTQGGQVTIQLLYSDMIGRLTRLGYLLHIKSLQCAADMDKKVMIAGGELLERRKLKRSGAGKETFMQAKYEQYDKAGIIL